MYNIVLRDGLPCTTFLDLWVASAIVGIREDHFLIYGFLDSTRCRPPGAADREFWLYFVGFLASKLVRMAPDPQDSFGPSFRPNGRLWTRFGPFSMIWAGTDVMCSVETG